MSVNSSSNSSVSSPQYYCFVSETNISIYLVFIITYSILLLPLIILVFYFGYKRWRKQCSAATANNISHSDIFTFNMVVVELLGVLGCCFYCVGTFTKQRNLRTVEYYLLPIIVPGQTLFHLLTCVDRYLAVVHSITYLGLRQRGGVRIRNISIVCVWLLCFGSLILNLSNHLFNLIFSLLIFGLSCIAVSFCSISVLCVLIRPGPGEVGGNRERVDQSKLRAFHTIMAIMGALFLRFLNMIISYVIFSSPVLKMSEICLLGTSASWLSLPSSLVLPLLFLHRAGKLPGCKHNTKSG